MKEYKSSPALDAGLLAAAQAVEHDEISRYGTVMSWAQKLGLDDAVEAIAELPPDQLVRFSRGYTAFETGRADHAKELDFAATKLGRHAGRAFADEECERYRQRYRASAATPSHIA